MNTRAFAATVLTKLIQEKISLNELLAKPLLQQFKPQDQSFIQELCYGTARWYFQLAALIKPLLQKPIKDKDFDIFILLLIGVYQLQHLRTPVHAAVSETVNAVTDLKKPWAKGLINAVLRNFQRRQTELQAFLIQDPVAYYAHPKWLTKLLQQAWPAQWQQILDANNHYPPMTLRVNLKKINRDEYLTLLAAQKIIAKPAMFTATGITLAQPMDVWQLPGFKDGLVSIQDNAAQLAANLLELQPGQRVLDACAAPGGKTCHILETEPNLKELIAIDNDPKRLEKITENFNRLDLSAKLICANAEDTQTWWDGNHFDRILLDAPCSATGVIRRHPDIKLLRKAADISQLAAKQLALLEALWPLIKPGGLLIYATCSILPEENAQVVQSFLGQHKDAQQKIIEAEWGIPVQTGRQILPGAQGMDGFFYVKLLRLS